MNQKVNTSSNNVISISLEANVFRDGETTIINDDDLNALTLTQLTTNEYIIDLRTEISFANMYLRVKGFSYIGLSATNNTTFYKDTTVSRHLDVDGVTNTTKKNLTNDDANNFPLVITNNGGN